MIFRKIFHRNEDGEHNFWMSYTDLMSGFLVVFIIISAVMYKNYQDKTRESNASLKNLIVEYKDVFYLDDPNISVEFNSDRGSIILTHHNPQKYLFASGKDRRRIHKQVKVDVDKGMKECPNCHAENPIDANYCRKCTTSFWECTPNK